MPTSAGLGGGCCAFFQNMSVYVACVCGCVGCVRVVVWSVWGGCWPRSAVSRLWPLSSVLGLAHLPYSPQPPGHLTPGMTANQGEFLEPPQEEVCFVSHKYSLNPEHVKLELLQPLCPVSGAVRMEPARQEGDGQGPVASHKPRVQLWGSRPRSEVLFVLRSVARFVSAGLV